MSVPELHGRQVACRRCPRLIQWCQEAAQNPPARFRGQEYWGGPIPSLGEAGARLLIVGLAPAAHGGNRTGRVFTGDRSGDWLFRAMYRAGFCNQETSTYRLDGLQLHDCYITAACHCAPPDNKPLPEEIKNCRPFLLEELRILTSVRVVLGLGKIGFDAAYSALREARGYPPVSRPVFGHGAEFAMPDGLVLMGTYHPSQQITFTGRLTETMLDAIFLRAAELVQIESTAARWAVDRLA